MAQLPGPGERSIVDPLSRLLFSWESQSCALRALTGEVATFTRSATGTALDDNGTSRTLVNNQPRWQWEDTDNDAVRDTPFLLLGQTGELVKWTLVHQPALSTTFLLDFIEGGARTVVNAGVFYIGNDAATGARIYIDSTGTFYRATHNNGTAAVTSTMASGQPAVGDRVRLRLEYSGATGVIRLYQSINAGAEVAAAASGANTPAAAWGASTLRLGSIGTANLGVNRFRRCKLAYGGAVALATLEGVR